MTAQKFGRFLMIANFIFSPITLGSLNAHAAIESAQKKESALKSASTEKKSRWLLKDFIALVQSDPNRLLKIGEKLFSDERLRMSALEPSLAHEWQHRLAVSTSLSELFHPALTRKNSNIPRLKLRARKILSKALLADPSLLVRDGSVESLRRIFKMNPAESKNWKSALEKAFLSEKNTLNGEGFFIRETILTAFKESRMKPTRKIIVAGLRDKNDHVRVLAKDPAWKLKRASVKRRRK